MIINNEKSAKLIPYDNANSDMTAGNVQDAIDQLENNMDKMLALLKGYLSNYVMVVNTTINVTLEAGKSATYF